jgi:hypothetical protein
MARSVVQSRPAEWQFIRPLVLNCGLDLLPFTTGASSSGRRKAQRRVELAALEVTFERFAEDAIPALHRIQLLRSLAQSRQEAGDPPAAAPRPALGNGERSSNRRRCRTRARAEISRNSSTMGSKMSFTRCTRHSHAKKGTENDREREAAHDAQETGAILWASNLTRYDVGRQKGLRARTGSSSDQSPCSSTWPFGKGGRASMPREIITRSSR